MDGCDAQHPEKLLEALDRGVFLGRVAERLVDTYCPKDKSSTEEVSDNAVQVLPTTL